MRKILFILISILTASLSSCSIYEDITFGKNGEVSYNMTLDMSEMFMMVSSDKVDHMLSDSTSSLVDIICKDGEISEENMAAIKDDLDNLKPMFLSLLKDDANQTAKIMMYGNFINAEAFNKAMKSLKTLSTSADLFGEEAAKSKSLKLRENSILNWNGRKMKISTASLDDKSGSKEENLSNAQEMLQSFMASGKYKVKYHFPHKVKHVSDPNAMLSQDQKTVIIEYPILNLSSENNNIDIEIETE